MHQNESVYENQIKKQNDQKSTRLFRNLETFANVK